MFFIAKRIDCARYTLQVPKKNEKYTLFRAYPIVHYNS